MKISYEVTIDDLIECNREMRKRLPPYYGRFYEWANRTAMIATLLLTLYAFITIEDRTIAWVVAALVVALLISPRVGWYLQGRPNPAREQFALEGNETLYGRRTIETSSDGFVIRGSECESHYPWSTIRRVIRGPEAIHIMVGRSLAHPVPASGPRAPKELAELLFEIKSHVPPDRFEVA